MNGDVSVPEGLNGDRLEAVHAQWGDTLSCWRTKNSQQISQMIAAVVKSEACYNHKCVIITVIIWITLSKNKSLNFNASFCNSCSDKIIKVAFQVLQSSVATYLTCDGDIITILLQISFWIRRWKNFENLLTFRIVMSDQIMPWVLFDWQCTCIIRFENMLVVNL